MVVEREAEQTPRNSTACTPTGRALQAQATEVASRKVMRDRKGKRELEEKEGRG